MLRDYFTFDWFTIFIVIGLISITMAKGLFKARFRDFVLVFGNSKYLKIYAREQKFIDTFDGLLFTNFVISMGIFLFLCFNTLVEPLEFNLFVFAKILTALALFLLIKILIERLIGSIFDIEPLMDTYLFQKTTYKNFSGLLLSGANLFLLYSKFDTRWVIYISLGMLLIIHLVGFITSFKDNLRAINLNFFYFLLYLCALEIGPYILLYKVLKEYNG